MRDCAQGVLNTQVASNLSLLPALDLDLLSAVSRPHVYHVVLVAELQSRKVQYTIQV